jgi:hypothetical protein
MAKRMIDSDTLDELLLVGSIMSNVCFNIGQESGRTIKETHERQGVKELQKRWDAALRKVPKAKKAKDAD